MFGEELEVQDMEALRQKIQKPELWGEGIERIIVGHLGALRG